MKVFFHNVSNDLEDDKLVKTELYNIVTETWKNRASVNEIQRVMMKI